MADRKSIDAKKIELTGVVQGIGFRPFVYRLAKKYNLAGSIKNISGNVEILVTGEIEAISSFIKEVVSNPPAHAVIENTCISDIPAFGSKGFTIEDSGAGFNGFRFFSPDLSICPNCKAEIFNSLNSRYRHYFNTCVSCGPRFSVMKEFPYDRKNTSMVDFDMCDDCSKEYENPTDRRFHAETIACNNCGPTLRYSESDVQLTGDSAFWRAIDNLKNGKIVAIKGIGGYHFACSPYDSESLLQLRERKGREHKPFAIMFKDIKEIERICLVSEEEKKLLISSARPIVLLHMKNHTFAEETLYDNCRCGCFLPYTPLHELIMEEIPCLVMTSANISDSPIIKDEGEICSITDKVLYNDREIVRSVEDSVVQTVYKDKVQIIRRARGYVPAVLEVENLSGRNILAVGGDLKAAFSLMTDKFLTMSQYFGDLENAEVMRRYRDSIDDYIKLFNVVPQQIVCDSHPRYFSGHIAEQLSKYFEIPLLRVFHHHGHIAAVMAEHGLNGRVIGIAFDGSGYGDDGNIWGGEFLICENNSYTRFGHFEYITLLGADAAAREAEKTAACFLYNSGITSNHKNQSIITSALTHNINTYLSSGVGRLFDAVASIIGVCNENLYEGQCASALQYCAERAVKSGISPVQLSFTILEKNGRLIIDQNEIISRAYCDSKSVNFSPEAFALGFHIALSDVVLRVCKIIREKEKITQVALSGGVFQNSLLLSMCADKLAQNGFFVYFNSMVPPNDGGLALGQSYIAALQGKN